MKDELKKKTTKTKLVPLDRKVHTHGSVCEAVLFNR